MKRGTQIALLSAMLGSAATIAAIWAFQPRPALNPEQSKNFSARREVHATNFPDTSLHTKGIETRRSAEYVPQGGDLTRYAVRSGVKRGSRPGGPVITRPVPDDNPLVLPAKFFGYGNVPLNAARRAFFEDGEEVHIVSEGDTLLGRFRILKINNASIDFEEVGSGRRGQKMLEDQGPA